MTLSTAVGTDIHPAGNLSQGSEADEVRSPAQFVLVDRDLDVPLMAVDNPGVSRASTQAANESKPPPPVCSPSWTGRAWPQELFGVGP
jgi:hypothetical protein